MTPQHQSQTPGWCRYYFAKSPSLIGKIQLFHMGMDQYLLIPFLGGWTSIYQLFWCELQGYKVLTHIHIFPGSSPHFLHLPSAPRASPSGKSPWWPPRAAQRGRASPGVSGDFWQEWKGFPEISTRDELGVELIAYINLYYIINIL